MLSPMLGFYLYKNMQSGLYKHLLRRTFLMVTYIEPHTVLQMFYSPSFATFIKGSHIYLLPFFYLCYRMGKIMIDQTGIQTSAWISGQVFYPLSYLVLVFKPVWSSLLVYLPSLYIWCLTNPWNWKVNSYQKKEPRVIFEGEGHLRGTNVMVRPVQIPAPESLAGRAPN